MPKPLIAMLFVPVYYGHYKLLIAAASDRINILQLSVNVTFVALLGALCANMSKRVALWTGGAVAAIGVVALWLAAIARAENDEHYANELMSDAEFLRSKTPDSYNSADELAERAVACLDEAKEKLRNAADNWHWAGNWAREKTLRVRANFTPPTPKFDPITAKPVGDIFDQVAAEPAHGTITEDDIAATGSPPQASEYDALLPKASEVAPNDLKKITLFDVDVKENPSAERLLHAGHSINGFYGRVRNDLSRSVEKLVLRASLYNPAGELIEG